jgi:hypothetical protein
MSNELKELTATFIQTQVVKALTDAPKYIETLVGAALNDPVQVGGQYSGKMRPWLQEACDQIIRRATQTAVEERITELMPLIREKVAERLTTDTIIDSFASAIQLTVKDNWRINVNFGKEKD